MDRAQKEALKYVVESDDDNDDDDQDHEMKQKEKQAATTAKKVNHQLQHHGAVATSLSSSSPPDDKDAATTKQSLSSSLPSPYGAQVLKSLEQYDDNDSNSSRTEMDADPNKDGDEEEEGRQRPTKSSVDDIESGRNGMTMIIRNQVSDYYEDDHNNHRQQIADSQIRHSIRVDDNDVGVEGRAANSNAFRDYNNNNNTMLQFGDEALNAELVIDTQARRQQAKQDIEERLMATAVTAEEAFVVKDDEEDRILFRRLCRWMSLIILIVIIIIIVVVGVTIGRSASSSNANGMEPIPNSTCSTAFDIDKLIVSASSSTNATTRSLSSSSSSSSSSSFTITLKGNTTARSGNFTGISCQLLEDEGGYGQWYHLQGTGQKLSASTCNDDDDDDDDDEGKGDTQLLVFTGSCDALTCVAAGDELCGGHGSVGWWASQDVNYYILVRGTRASSISNFTLTIRPMDDNGDCSFASPVAVDISSVAISASGGISLFGSTRNDTDTTVDNPNSAPSCFGSEVSGPSSWYRIEGDDSVKCASLLVEGDFSAIDFPATLAVYKGGCEELQCLSEGVEDGEEIAWAATADNYYHLSVHGGKNQTGDFFLCVRTAPPNSLCETATPISIRRSRLVTTTGSCAVFQHLCTIDSNEHKKVAGVFFLVQGSGNLMVASTCRNGTIGAKQTSIIVFDGSNGCSSLDCIETSYEESTCESGGIQLSSQWQSEENVPYYIFVEDIGSIPINVTVSEV